MDLQASFHVPFRHRLFFTAGALEPHNHLLAEAIGSSAQAGAEGGGADGSVPADVLAFVDDGVAEAWPELDHSISAYAAAHADHLRLAGPIVPVPGGEPAKNDWSVVERLLRAMHDAGLCRQSFALAIGGGAVLDAVGFAAALVHRGVRCVRMPTTTLGQADSGVGVKNGVNAFGKKNFLGTFAPPWAVINDERFLTTLSERDWLAGFSEAVKVAAVKDAAFFERIRSAAPRLRRRDLGAARPIIEQSAAIHFNHIVRGDDPFELTTARPLDFGHWAAHKLEQMTGFRLRHGEAVSIGIALDATYSMIIGMLSSAECSAVCGCLRELGLPICDAAMDDRRALLAGLEEFREHLGGPLTITLLRRIGEEVDVHEIDAAAMGEAMALLAAGAARAGAA